MESLRFCSRCGGILEKGFLYCPYCGMELVSRPIPEKILSKSFERLEVQAMASSLRRLDGCGDALDRMEKELDSFLGGKRVKKPRADADLEW